jgi:hypothetical protein
MLDFLAAIGLVIYILGGFVILKALIKEKDLSFWFFLLPLIYFLSASYAESFFLQGKRASQI